MFSNINSSSSLPGEDSMGYCKFRGVFEILVVLELSLLCVCKTSESGKIKLFYTCERESRRGIKT